MTSFCYLLNERSTARLGGTRQCLCASVFSIAVVIFWTALCSAQLPDETENRLITIMAPDEQIRLASDEPVLPFAVPDRSEWPTHGVFTIHATAFLPSWGVSIAAESLRGPQAYSPLSESGWRPLRLTISSGSLVSCRSEHWLLRRICV